MRIQVLMEVSTDQTDDKAQRHSCQRKERVYMAPLTSTRILMMSISPKLGKGLNTRRPREKKEDGNYRLRTY